MRRLILNRFTTVAADHLLLSLLWLAGCLPLVTVPASTAALFEVARQRQRGDEPALFRAFGAAWRRYWWPTLPIGLAWAAMGGLLAVDLVIATQLGGAGGDALLVALIALSIVYALVSTALFPVVVSFEAGPRHQLRTAALVAVLFPGRGLLALVVVAAAAGAVWTVPLAILAAPSLVATIHQRLYQGAFHRLPSPSRSPAAAVAAAGHPDLVTFAMSLPKENPR